MVFKPFTHFARQKLIKSFTHGYAQTVVAASQSSYAASTGAFPFTQPSIARYGKSGTPQVHNAFQSSSGSSGAGTKAGSSSSSQNDSGLAAYYAAWQQANNGDGDSEWKQFQFAKRIGWRGPSALRETVDKSKNVTSDVKHEAKDGELTPRVRSNSTSAVDELKKSSSAEVDVQAEAPPRVHPAPAVEVQTEQATNQESAVTASTRSNIVSPDLSSELSSGDNHTTASSVSDSRSQSFLDHIEELHATGKHAEVPVVFEAMLLADGKPTTSAYNALLTAAVRVPATKHQAAHKAWSVYTDMHRRDVSPDTTTYSTLIGLFASRALDVARAKDALAQRRARYQKVAGNGLFSAVHDVEADILAEDGASTALQLFEAFASTQLPALPVTTYELLTTVCAEYGKPTNMIAIYAHMESQHVAPSTDIFTAMIPGFAKNGDLISAVECYNEYKSLAVAADAGQFDLLNRADDRVYTALMKAYVLCGKSHGAARFFDKIRETSSGDQMAVLEDMAVPEAFVQEMIKLGQLEEASSWLDSTSLSLAASTRAWSRIAVAAADKGAVGPAVHAFEQLPLSSSEQLESAAALLAMHLRLNDFPSASVYWDILNASSHPWSSSLVEPATMYVAGLLENNHSGALAIARQAYARIRSAAVTPQERASAVEEIDTAIESLGRYMREAGIVPAAKASMDLMRSMVDNGGLVPSVSMQILNGLGAEALGQLDHDDVVMVTQIQGSLILSPAAQADLPSLARFASLVEFIMATGAPLDERTVNLVDKTLQRMEQDRLFGRPDLLLQWRGFLQRGTQAFPSPTYTHSVVSPVSPVDRSSSFDPYGASTDHRGSSIIADALDKKDRFGGSRLKEALMTFRNIRRGGRHPRYATYAKLISAAAREHKADLMHELLALAKVDVPYLAHYPAVLQGWTTILDCMVSASLSLGDRPAALRYHEELSAMGGAPSANTFGLYITTLKESTKTFDEATEAVKIFHRAKAEGVEPTSFLYNALIGKLGKARRIDDTLYYFGEMRNLGIQPTSVTYGTVVNALCRVSDKRHAEELFEEMESMPNYKPRPAPYNSLMQFYLTTKRDRSKVLALYDRMVSKNIAPASHTFKLLIDAYAIEPVDMRSAEAVLDQIRQAGLKPEAVHYASLIHARGCTVRDMEGTRHLFEEVLADQNIAPQACIYQAYLEAMVANHQVAGTPDVLNDMKHRGVAMTAYIANTLIHGWALEGNISMARAIYAAVGVSKREPSTYYSMARAFLAVSDRDGAMKVVQELSGRGYPPAVTEKIYELVSPTKTTSEVITQMA